MKPLKDLYWVEIEKEQEDSIEVGSSGVKLYLDSSYDPMRHSRQWGILHETPINNTLDLGLEKGDKVWFHHFVPDEKNRIKLIKDKSVYQAQPDQIYARERDGEVKAVGRWNFVRQEVVKDEVQENGFVLNNEKEDVLLHGEIVYPSKQISKEISSGDSVIFSKGSEYDMPLNGESLLRIRNVDILAKNELR